MPGMNARGTIAMAIVASLALVRVVPAASARSLEDAVKLAVIKKEISPNFQRDKDAGKQVSAYWDYFTGRGYTFGSFRLMSLTSDEVCGSFKRANGPSKDFLYVDGNVFEDPYDWVGTHCHKPYKTALTGDHGGWNLSCIDQASDSSTRNCSLFVPLSTEGEKSTLGIFVVKGDGSNVVADLILAADAPRGRRVDIVIAGETTSCAPVPALGQENVFWPCDQKTSERLASKFLDSKAMTVTFGERSRDFAVEEPRHLFDEAKRYFLTFPGGEHPKPQ